MVTHLNDSHVFEGDITSKGELLTEGSLTVGVGGLAYGESVASPDSWPSQVRVQVANTTERAAVVAWRNANDPITASKPLLVWRADGSLTGVNEITLDGVNWYAETPLSGDIKMTMASAAPYGWLLLQGQLLVNAVVNYPALWAAADPVFRVGIDLRLPDLRGRVPMGAGTGTGLTLRNLGDAVGAENVVLTEAQLAAHDHSIAHNHAAFNTAEAGTHDHTFNVRYRDDLYSTAGGKEALTGAGGANHGDLDGSDTGTTFQSGSAHAHTIDVPAYAGDSGVSGSNQGHPNVQPSAVVNFKVKV